jgi:nucleotide-binding universal stress UspA family protein
MKNLLVGVDLKSSDMLLLAQASALATKFNSKIWIIHIATPEPDFVGYGIGPKYIRDVLADELRSEHRQIQTYTQNLHDQSIEAEGLLIQGPTIEMIQSEVVKLKIDLLILGSHRHSFLYETFVGHTAIKMMNQLSIPLLIVPLPNES